MSAKHTPGQWRVSVVKAGKARAAQRIWILGPNRQSAGYFPSVERAQAECDRRNAAIAKATGCEA